MHQVIVQTAYLAILKLAAFLHPLPFHLHKGRDLVTAFAFCFITDEMTTDKVGKITVSPISWGFPAFASILLIS